MSAPLNRRAPLLGLPRPGVFAVLTCMTAASSPALYYGAGAEGLSYLVALVAVPAVAAVGVVRSGRRSRGRVERPHPGRSRLAFLPAAAAVPAALAADVAMRRALDVDEEGWLSVALFIYGAVLLLGLLGVFILRRMTSTRAVLAALGLAAAPVGVFLFTAGIGAGLVLAASPLLLGAAAASPPAPVRQR